MNYALPITFKRIYMQYWAKSFDNCILIFNLTSSYIGRRFWHFIYTCICTIIVEHWRNKKSNWWIPFVFDIECMKFYDKTTMELIIPVHMESNKYYIKPWKMVDCASTDFNTRSITIKIIRTISKWGYRMQVYVKWK